MSSYHDGTFSLLPCIATQQHCRLECHLFHQPPPLPPSLLPVAPTLSPYNVPTLTPPPPPPPFPSPLMPPNPSMSTPSSPILKTTASLAPHHPTHVNFMAFKLHIYSGAALLLDD
ncbi:hypothetical protein BDQ17DRAFT_1428138 [Cyathus striatus]|nr:hypothetical protein BDQ17DRAFT_1428138 [Cyathus striatus]